jgi:hypothetical protein
MGIPGFLNFLKRNYRAREPWLKKELKPDKKWDYLILDFQSIIYSLQGEIGNEINYFIRLFENYKALTELSDKKTFLLEHYKKITTILEKYNEYFEMLKLKPSEIISTIETEVPKIKINDSVQISAKLNGVLTIFVSRTIYNPPPDYKSKWEDYLVKKTVEFVKHLADTHVKTYDTYSKTLVFFDGVPSLSKIKEQVSRRVYPKIIDAIKKSIDLNSIISGDQTIENEILEKAVSMPSIGPGTNFSAKLYSGLSAVEESVKGKFVINNEKVLGEAEHQIMKYIQFNKETFQDKEILLASPDADLILLNFINKVKGINIDIIRIDKINEDNYDFKLDNFNSYNDKISPFKIIYEYIFIDKLLESMGLDIDTQKDKILDISYILLLLGDDFLPKIPTFQVNSLVNIFNAYDRHLIKNPYSNIINFNGMEYLLNFESLINYLSELLGEEVKMNKHTIENHNGKINSIDRNLYENLLKYGEIKMLPKTLDTVYNITNRRPSDKPFFDLKTCLSWMLENKGLYLKKIEKELPSVCVELSNGKVLFNNRFYSKLDNIFSLKTTLFDSTSKPSKPIALKKFESTTPEYPEYKAEYQAKMNNYLEGFSFILDLYLNNRLKNYEWYFKYNSSPTIHEIHHYMIKNKSTLNEIFNYAKSNSYTKLKYMNLATYRQFLDNSQLKLLKAIANNVIDKSVSFTPADKLTRKMELERLTITSSEYILETYFTYNNVPFIFECGDNFYVNKCLEGTIVDSIEDYQIDIVVNPLDDLEIKKKYLKYKAKYIELKKQIGM